jgi:hypothetical protein
MAFEKVNYDFPHEGNKKPQIDIEDSGAIEIDLSSKGKAEEKKVEPEAPKELEIEVVDDTPKADRNRKASEPPEDVTDDELADYSEKVRKRIQHFSKGYHDERRAKEAAFREKQELESLAKTLVEENKKLKGNVSKNQEALLEQAKKSASSELENAQKAYKTAYEAGDSDAVVKAQQDLTKAEIKTDKLQNFKLPTLQQTETPVQPETKGSVPNTQAQQQVDEKAVAWSQKNPWFGTDDEMTSLALGLHNKLAKQGINLQSDEYYEAIDTRMRQLFPDQFDGGEEKTEAEQPKQKPNVVAPATRSLAPKKVKLSKTQVAIAKRLGVPLELYAQKVAEESRKENG